MSASVMRFMLRNVRCGSLKRDAIQYGMPDKQRQALPLILAGKTDKEVGEACGGLSRNRL